MSLELCPLEELETQLWQMVEHVVASYGHTPAFTVVASVLRTLAAHHSQSDAHVELAPARAGKDSTNKDAWNLEVQGGSVSSTAVEIHPSEGYQPPLAGASSAAATAVDNRVQLAVERGSTLNAPPLPRLQPIRVAQSAGRARWAELRGRLAAVRELALAADPGPHLRLHQQPAERATRHRYDPHTKEWHADEVIVKMAEARFAHGAMRECFAMKQLAGPGPAAGASSWRRAANYVAKRYMKPAARADYFADVELQMEARSLGAAFNRLGPPKCVDVMQCWLLEFRARDGSPLYGVEPLVEGDYVKYNSNNSFVLHQDDGAARNTPQAFSHFTYEHSGGRRMVVDVQGVGDLYTDPQIHTRDGRGYGQGNLGCRGFALFFRTHVCSPLCRALGLRRFPLCLQERRRLGRLNKRGTVFSPEGSPKSPLLEPGPTSLLLRLGGAGPAASSDLEVCERVAGPRADADAVYQSVSKAAAARAPGEAPTEALVHWHVAQLHADACLEPDHPAPSRDSAEVLGAQGLYHLRLAAVGGGRAAALVLWRLHSGLPTGSARMDALHRAARPLLDTSASRLATAYLYLAARGGVPQAALLLAQQLHSGRSDQGTDCAKALEIYRRAYCWMAPADEDTPAEAEPAAVPASSLEAEDIARYAPESEWPVHEVAAAMGALLAAGGAGLPRAPRAAAAMLRRAALHATRAAKGKLADKYYQQAAALDEDDDCDSDSRMKEEHIPLFEGSACQEKHAPLTEENIPLFYGPACQEKHAPLTEDLIPLFYGDAEETAKHGLAEDSGLLCHGSTGEHRAADAAPLGEDEIPLFYSSGKRTPLQEDKIPLFYGGDKRTPLQEDDIPLFF